MIIALIKSNTIMEVISLWTVCTQYETIDMMAISIHADTVTTQRKLPEEIRRTKSFSQINKIKKSTVNELREKKKSKTTEDTSH